MASLEAGSRSVSQILTSSQACLKDDASLGEEAVKYCGVINLPISFSLTVIPRDFMLGDCAP